MGNEDSQLEFTPKVNPANAFFEITNNYVDQREFIREAISNAFDANAKNIFISIELVSKPLSNSKQIYVKIEDDGDGMACDLNDNSVQSELNNFFNLGYSSKDSTKIGCKGLGTMTYFFSDKIKVTTCKNNIQSVAETKEPVYETLRDHKIPSIIIFQGEDIINKGTIIEITGYKGTQKDFKDLAYLKKYINWYTIIGSFQNYFSKQNQNFQVHIKVNQNDPFEIIKIGLRLPVEQNELLKGTRLYCYHFPPETMAFRTTTGTNDEIQLLALILGEEKLKELFDNTYNQLGLWLCKDFIKIERSTSLLNFSYGSDNILIFANCQSFQLSANRNNIQKDENYNTIIDIIETYIMKIQASEQWIQFQRVKQKEIQDAIIEENRKIKEQKTKSSLELLEWYEKRSDLKNNSHNLFLKVPENEAETILLLQSMISANHPGIDFKIGAHSPNKGVDLITVHTNTLGETLKQKTEAVHTISKLFAWAHPSDSFDVLVCWDIDGFEEHKKPEDDFLPELTKDNSPGKYFIKYKSKAVPVYVLKEFFE